jgi:hypothetical protein
VKRIVHLPHDFRDGFDRHPGPHFMIVDDNVDVDQDLSMRHDPPWTKQSHPYCYDPFTIWGAPRQNPECNGTVYTDRLDQWDRGKYERLAAKHYRIGDHGERPFDSHNCKGHLIERFLRDWFDDPELKLLRVVEYCSPATGYQTWRLDYASKKDAT